MSDFLFPQSGIEGQPRRKHRPSPLNLAPQHSSARAPCNSGGRGPLPVQNVYVGTPAQYTGSPRRSHRSVSSQTHGSVDETPETPRTRANIMRNVAPIFAMINSRAAAIGVTATLDGDRFDLSSQVNCIALLLSLYILCSTNDAPRVYMYFTCRIFELKIKLGK